MVFCISTELHASTRTRNSSCMMNNPPETRAFLPRASLGHAVDGFLQLELHMQSNITLERKSEMYLGMITIIISMKNPRSNSKSKKENSFWSLWNTTTSLMEDLDAEMLQQTCMYLSFRWRQYYCGSHDLHGTEHCRLQGGWHRHAAPETVSIPKWVQRQEQQQQHEEEDEEENPNYPPEDEHRPKSWESPRSL